MSGEAPDRGGRSDAGRGRLEGALVRAYAFGAAVFIAAVARSSLIEHQRLPNFDDWRALAALDSMPFGAWLLSSQNGHLMPATLWLYHADYTHGLGEGRLLVVASLLLAAVAGGALAVAFRAGGAPRSPAARAVLVFMLFLLFWAASLQTFLWGRAVHNPITTACLLVAIACLVVHSTRREGGRPVLVAASGSAALLATFSFGTGFATWPALLAVALAARLPARISLSLAAAGILAFAAYAFVLAGDANRSATFARRALEHPADALAFTAAFLGAAVARASAALGAGAAGTLGLAAGGAGMLAFAVYAARLLRPGRREAAAPRELLALALMTFAIVAGVMAGLARTSFASPEASKVRFVPWSALFWMGAACAWLTRTERRSARGLSLLVALPLLSLALLPASRAALDANAARRRTLEEGSLALLVGLHDDRLARRLVGGRPTHVYAALDRLERDARGPFADGRAAWRGRRLSDFTREAPPGSCRGAIEEWVGLPSDERAGARLHGTVWDARSDGPPASVVITDGTGNVRGLGNVLPEARGKDSRSARWYGFVARHPGDDRYVAYAVSTDGSACRFGALSAPRG